MRESPLITISDVIAIKQLPSTSKTSDRLAPYILEAQRFDLQQSIGYALYNELLNVYGTETCSIEYDNLAISTFDVGEIVTIKLESGTVIGQGTVVSDSGSVLVLSDVNADLRLGATILGSTSLSTADITEVTHGKYFLLVNGEEYTDPDGYQVNYMGLKMPLAYWTYARFIENQQVTVTDTGLVEKNSQWSQQVTAQKVASQIAQARSAALSCMDTVTKYMNDKNSPTVIYDLWEAFYGTNKNQSAGYRITSVDRETRGREYDRYHKRWI